MTSQKLTLTINGDSHTTQSATLGELLNELGFTGKPVVIEHNRRAILPGDQTNLPLTEGDEIEIILITAGG